jgi:hypothetical protein
VAFKRMKRELPKEQDEAILQYAVKAVNNTVGPEGLTPSLLVYGSIPRPERNVPAATQIERARTVDMVRKEIATEYAGQKISYGLRHQGPVERERAELENLPFGAKVSIYRSEF